MSSIIWRAGATAGAAAAVAAAVLLTSAGAERSVDVASPGDPGMHVPEPMHDAVRVRVSVRVAVEDAPAAHVTEPSPESRRSEPESENADMGEYVDPDGPVPPPATRDDSVHAEGDFQDPEYDLPLPAPRDRDGKPYVGDYIDPGDAP